MTTVINDQLNDMKSSDFLFKQTFTLESNSKPKQNPMSLSTNDIFDMEPYKDKCDKNTCGVVYSSLITMSSYDSCRVLNELEYGSRSLPSANSRSYTRQLIDFFPVFWGKRKAVSYFQKTSSSITLTEVSRKHYNDLWVGSLK